MAQLIATQTEPAAQGNERALVLVSCSSKKATCTMPARGVYTSPLFQKSARWAEQQGLPWFVLSAKHGLLHPNGTVAPYDQTLLHMSPSERQQWARGVEQQLLAVAQGWGVERLRILLLAGAAYGGWIPLVQTWCTVTEPMKGMQIGRRLQWVTKQLNVGQETLVSDTAGTIDVGGAEVARCERLENPPLVDSDKRIEATVQRQKQKSVAAGGRAEGSHAEREGHVA